MVLGLGSWCGGPKGHGAGAGPLMGRMSSWSLLLWGLKFLQLALALLWAVPGPGFVTAGLWVSQGWYLPQVDGVEA